MLIFHVIQTINIYLDMEEICELLLFLSELVSVYCIFNEQMHNILFLHKRKQIRLDLCFLKKDAATAVCKHWGKAWNNIYTSSNSI